MFESLCISDMEFRVIQINHKQVKTKPMEKIANELKSEIINHLTGISNQDVSVPITGHKDISVKDLINEVKNESPIAIAYACEYVETISLIKKAREEKTSKRWSLKNLFNR